ncbi:MAG: RNA methyltransferase [Breznakibacter sp.]
MRKLSMEELNRLTPEAYKETNKLPVTIVLDNVRSLNNVGSIFRTADALLIEEIILTGITATPPHKEIHKTALGAEDTVAWRYFENTLDAIAALKEQGYTICSLEQVTNSVSLVDFKPEGQARYALVFGNEVKGVQQEVIQQSDLCLEIPQFGTKHSFNVSVTAGIVMWEFFKNLHA